MKKIVWTTPAHRSFKAIIRFIALEQPYTAEGLRHQITESLTKLTRFPKLGHRLISKAQPSFEYRQVVIPPCRIVYLVEKDKIIVINVLRTEETVRMAWMVAERLAEYSLSTTH